jgi:hypothetical protein
MGGLWNRSIGREEKIRTKFHTVLTQIVLQDAVLENACFAADSEAGICTRGHAIFAKSKRYGLAIPERCKPQKCGLVKEKSVRPRIITATVVSVIQLTNITWDMRHPQQGFIFFQKLM